MVTAESVKTKIQGLIDTANATTGKADTDLTAAVGSLVDGFGGGGNAEAYMAMINGTDIPDGGGTVAIPDGVTRVPAYLYSSKLNKRGPVHLILPSGLKDIEQYGVYCIGNQIGDAGSTVSFNDDLENIGRNAFELGGYCEFINLPTSLIKIGNSAFAGVQRYVSSYSQDIYLPVVESIGSSAFKNFNFAGSNIHLGSKITSIGTDAFKFKGTPVFTLLINRAEDTVSGAPWGATNATIIWEGDS